jgi:hypothetical protein
MGKNRRHFQQNSARVDSISSHALWKIGLVAILSISSFATPAREKDATQYGMGLIVNIPFPEAEVTQVVQDIIQNGIIRGTKEYNKDEYVSGAEAASATRAFPEWTEGGKVFYKLRLKAIDPRNFKDSSDVGTLAVRYVVQGQDEKHTVLRIDARFVEDFRHIAHASNGSVESAEYKDIHDHLDSIEVMKAQTAEAEKDKQAQLAKGQTVAARKEMSSSLSTANAAGNSAAADSPSTLPTAAALPAQTPPAQTLEEHVKDLRHQVQRLVKAPGAPLKSAPFHTASTLQSLATGTEVLIVVSTPYWLGVETHEGQHGWILRDDLELLP